jgi:tungstate transport system permease protein
MRALAWSPRCSRVRTRGGGVGAVIIVGGNIEGFTRTMTTAIALETSKGNLPLAVGLGLVLIAIVVVINALAWVARRGGERYAG